MRVYLGDQIAFAGALMVPILSVLTVCLGGMITLQDANNFIILVVCLVCSAIFLYFMWSIRLHLWAFGTFESDSVRVTAPFCKPYTIRYKDVRGCGIALYRHAYMNNPNSLFHTDIFYIFLSEYVFDEKYRLHMNQWDSAPGQIKAAFSQKLYEYLLENLPAEKAWQLQHDYKNYLVDRVYIHSKNEKIKRKKKKKQKRRK